jgi:hypothetical protein
MTVRPVASLQQGCPVAGEERGRRDPPTRARGCVGGCPPAVRLRDVVALLGRAAPHAGPALALGQRGTAENLNISEGTEDRFLEG